MNDKPTKPLASLDYVHDYGFTFHEDDTDQKNNLELEIVDLKRKLKSIKNHFQPLLENLSKEPDKAMIKWVSRSRDVEELKRILSDLTDV